MIIDSGRDHQFICAGLLDEFFQSGADGVRRADKGAGQHVGDMRFFHGRPIRLNIVNGRGKLAARAAHGIGKTLLGGSKKPPRFGIGLGGNYVHADHGVRFLELGRWPKFSPVNLQREHKRVGSEVGSKGVGQAELGRKLRAKETGAKNPNWHVETRAWNCLDRLPRLQRTEKRLKLAHIVGEIIGAGGITAKRAQGSLISTGSTAKPEIDTPGIERFQRAKLFRDHDGRMIGQHDSASANPDGLGAIGNVSDNDGSGGAGYPNHVVVLRQPETAITQALSVLRKIKGMVQGVRRGGSLRDECEIKN
jgi:hypothetical protein